MSDRTVHTAEASCGALSRRRVCCLIRSDSPTRNARTIKVAEAAASAGAQVTIVCSSTIDVALPVGPFEVVKVRTRAAISTHPLRVVRIVANLWRDLVQNPLTFALAAWRVDADIYHAHFLATLLPGLLASRFRRAKLVYDVRDLYVDAAAAKWPEWRVRYFTTVERHLIGRADAVLTVSEPMGQVLESRYGSLPLHVIFNGPYECSRSGASVSRPVRLFFQGAFRHNRNLDSLVRAMKWLRGRATLTLQGWGDEETRLRELVSELGLGDTVFFREPCSPSDVVACARDYDVGVICYRSATLNLEIAVPNKLLDYIGAGLAVAASDLAGHRSILSECGCGVLINPESDESIARDLDMLVSDPQRIAELKERAVSCCASLSWERQAAKLVAVYRDLIQ